jgi:phosphatidylglycerol:prolipoprotein diacylglycerol transferase
VHKVALDLGSFKIYWYGVLVATGFLAGLWTASRRGLRDGISAEKIVELGPWLLIGAILGARFLYVISHWRQDFAGHSLWQIFNLRSGLVYYGGLVGASLAVILKARLSHLPLWKLADVLAPSIALGHVFGRVGCLMTGCCYGRACDLPWAIQYPAGHETHPVGGLATPVHPTQIYESLLNLALYLTLAWLYRRKKFPGQVFATYLVGYAVLRAFVELFRGDYPVRYLGGHLTPGQLVSVGILLAGLVLFWRLPRGEAKHGQ